MKKENISSREGCRVNLTLGLEDGKAKPIRDISGLRCINAYKHTGHCGALLKTFLELFLTAPSIASVQTWKIQTTPSRRWYFRLHPWERHTFDTGFSLYPTLKASDGNKGIRTPEGAARERLRRKNGLDLPTILGGRPSPQFAEWLMGFPVGWSDCEDSGMQLSLKKPSCYLGRLWEGKID